MLPIRPVRGIKRYEEHLDFYRFTLVKKARRERSQASRNPGSEASFPYAREAEIDSAEQFAKAVAAVLGAAAFLKSLVEELGENNSGSVLERRIVHSSDPEALSALADPGAETGKCVFHVKHLASAQLNRTAYLAPDAPTNIEQGMNRIRLVAGDKSHELEWFISGGDTHKAVLKRIHASLNQVLPEMKTSLETDPSTGRIRLSLETRQTGAQFAFFIQDIKGNTAAATGLLVKDRQAADAQYRVDSGSWEVKSSNHISLTERGLHFELKSLPAEPVVLQISHDLPLIRTKLEGLERSLRSVEKELELSAEYINPAYAASLQHIRRTYQPEALPDKLSESLEAVTALLLGQDGLVASLRNFITRMEAGPAEELLNRENSRYKRYANYLSSLEWYSQLPSQGLLMNRFF
jgi:flagellar hook-associated protein 2